jgi:hypothetical protein
MKILGVENCTFLLNSSQKKHDRKNTEGFVLIRTHARKQQREVKLILILMNKQTLLCI